MGRGKTGNFRKAAAILLGCALLTGCGNTGEVDDYATNIGYEARGGNGTTQVVQSESGNSATTQTAGIPKEEIKVGVLHLSDPAEGSGYTYTHDLGIQGMQQNLGLSDDQIVRKINVNDGDAKATRQAIQECIDDGCNIIFTTSWGYMETTAEMAEEYPDVYFSHEQVLRQGPLGGQPLPGRQGAVQDVPPDAAVQVFIQRRSAAVFQGVGTHGLPPSDLIKNSEIDAFNHIIFVL